MDFMYYSNMGVGMKDMLQQRKDSSVRTSCQMFQQTIPVSLLSDGAAAAAAKGNYYCNNSSRSYNDGNHHHPDDDDDDHDDNDLRRGPWTVEEDLLLVNYITAHGEGRWNSLARLAGLKRTGKSCRLRWLNYLRPDVRRGNITPQEQLLILELHSRWGNRWSKIAQFLPGRTDNEIKNYWRTRVQKHARQLRCDVNSQKFKDVVRQLWMPRLIERIQAEAATEMDNSSAAATFDPASTFLNTAPQLSREPSPTALQQQQQPAGGAAETAATAISSPDLASSISTGSGVTSCGSVVTTNTTCVSHDLSSPTPPASDFSSPASNVVANLLASDCGWYDEVVDVFPATSGYPGQPDCLPSPGACSYYYNQGVTELDGMGYESSTTWTAPIDWSDTFWPAALDAEDCDVNAGLWSSALDELGLLTSN